MLGRWHLEALLLSAIVEKLQEAWGSPGGICSLEALRDNALTQIGWRFHKFLLYLSFGTNLFSLRWLRSLTLTSLQQDQSHLYPSGPGEFPSPSCESSLSALHGLWDRAVWIRPWKMTLMVITQHTMAPEWRGERREGRMHHQWLLLDKEHMCKCDSPGTSESPNLGYVAQKVFWGLKHILRLNMLWGTVQRSLYQHICPIPPPDIQQGCSCGHGNSLRDTAALKKTIFFVFLYSEKRKERDQCKQHKPNPVVLIFSAAFMWGRESAAAGVFLFGWPRMHQTLICVFSAHRSSGAVMAFPESGARRVQPGIWRTPGWCKRDRGS